MARLDRFRDAQADTRSGFAAALGELEAGRKTGHWIWYVFPQLVGLGQSMTAVHYGLADAAEAADYKLVSCMTLFAHVAAALAAENPTPRFTAMADHAGAILAAAAAGGYDRCVFTEASLNARAPDSGRRPGREGPGRRTRSGQ